MKLGKPFDWMLLFFAERASICFHFLYSDQRLEDRIGTKDSSKVSAPSFLGVCFL